MRRLLTLTAIGLAALLGTPTPALATSVIRMDLKELTERADVIVHGRCTRKQPRRSDEGHIVTDLSLEVFEAVKGKDLGRTFQFTVFGGIMPDRGSAISGAPVFNLGEEMLVFLSEPNAHGLRTVIGLAQGKYTIRREQGKTLAFRNLEGLRLVDSKTGEEAEADEPENGVPFAELLARVKAHLAEQKQKAR